MMGGPSGMNRRSWLKMIVSSSGRLSTLTPIVPLPLISPSSQVSPGAELMNPRSGTGNGSAATAAAVKMPDTTKQQGKIPKDFEQIRRTFPVLIFMTPMARKKVVIRVSGRVKQT